MTQIILEQFGSKQRCPKCQGGYITEAGSGGFISRQYCPGEAAGQYCVFGKEHLGCLCKACGFVWYEQCADDETDFDNETLEGYESHNPTRQDNYLHDEDNIPF